MEKKSSLNFVLLLVAAACAAPATRAAPASYVPDEIIVKFRTDVADALERQLEPTRPAGELTLSKNLHGLNARYRIKGTEPIFKNFKKNRQKLKALLKRDKAFLTRKEEHILSRLRRAPKDVRVPDLGRIYKIELDLEPGQTLEEVVAAYSSDPDVEYAELNYIISIDTTPNDPLYFSQWSLDKIDAAGAWDVNTGSSEVIVAVVDTGVDYNHRDIDDNMWVNPGEQPGDGNGDDRPGIAGVDDDGDGLVDEDSQNREPGDPNYTNDLVNDDDENGYADDIYGYDFINNDGDPIDDFGHGTHCSGIITAEGNNGLDIAGVCWNARIMALKFIDHLGGATMAAACEAIYYAVANGADVMSNSWAVSGIIVRPIKSLEEAIDYAYSQGAVIVAAAGNDGWDFPVFPAGYEHVIAVAATDSNDQLASFSNYGDWVDIAAPGVDVLSLLVTGMSMGAVHDDYTTFASGTSMACPHVAGACALILSQCPEIHIDVLTQLLLESTDPISPEFCTFGRLNLYKAMAGLSAGVVRLDRDAYPCSAMPVSIVVRDLDLMGAETQEVFVTTSGGDLETVTLSETSPQSGVFAGAILTGSGAPNAEDGTVDLAHGQSMTVTYEDADDGTGNPATVQDSAVIDCEPPTISNVQLEMRGVAAKITFETNELTTGRIRCDLECGGSDPIIAEDLILSTTHVIYLKDLTCETDYYYVVDANDAASNQTTDDNYGECYLLTTSTPFMLRVPGEYPTIQAAIDEAWDFGVDTVLVADGTYTGEGNRDVDFGGKAVTLRSENGPENCIIDCQASSSNKHRGFNFRSVENIDSVVDGFTITNGYGPEEKLGRYIRSVGGAIYCKDSSPKIINCIIKDNSAGYMGGGVYAYNQFEPFIYSNPTITDCIISGNHSGLGGGLCSCNGPISNCTISGNFGAGMYACRGPIDNCIITGNRGGGLHGCFGPISNCTISGNSAGEGGGLSHCWGPISNCIIRGNSANKKGGGGLSHCTFGPIRNCVITGNSTTGDRGGGGLHQCNCEIINCTISGNSASRCGGGIYDTALTTIPFGWPEPPYTTLTNCILCNNKAPDGPQIYLKERGKVGVSYSDVRGGKDDVDIGRLGGYLDWGLGNVDAAPLFVEPGYWADANDPNIIVEPDDPNAVWIDGDYHLSASSPCINAGDPNYDPGPNETDIDSEPRVINGCVDMGADEVDYEGPFIAILPTALQFYADEGGPNPESQILSIRNSGSGTLNWEITQDCSWLSVETSSGSSTGETDNVTVSVDVAGLVHGRYHCELAISDLYTVNSPQIVNIDLFVIGPAIIELSPMEFEFLADWRGENPPEQILTIRNSGSGTLNWQISCDCEWLEVNPSSGTSMGEADQAAISVDIAASGLSKYNYCELTISDPNYGAINSPQTIAVTLAVPDNDGVLHVPSEYETIQTAITWAEDSNTVIVAPGTYTGDGNRDINFLGKAITVRSTDPYDPGVVARTVIDCENKGRGFYFNSGEGEDSVISGLTIRNGTADRGGGIYCMESSPTINDCMITANSADRGAGIYGEDANPTIRNCTITENLAARGGGGIWCLGWPTIAYCTITGNSGEDGGGIVCNSRAKISYCTIMNNSAAYSGGGIDGAATLSYCTVSYNTAGFPGGGGIYCCRGDAKIANCLFVGNSGSSGGAIRNASGGPAIIARPTISNCTIVGNSATGTTDWTGYGGGIYDEDDTNSAITNCIVWGNTAIHDEPQIGGTGLTTVSYCNIQGGWGGLGNIDANPYFVDADNGDYHLLWDSPCIDKGDPGYQALPNETDFDGEPREMWGRVDIGCDEVGKKQADFTRDGAINFYDFAVFSQAWLSRAGNKRWYVLCDLHEDGVINAADLAELTENWLWKVLYVKAYNPLPADEAQEVNLGTILSWSTGGGVTSHQVYFGTDLDAVHNAATDSPEYMGNQDVTSWEPGRLEYGTTYYWRIDEKSDFATSKGQVWSFTTLGEPSSYLIGWWEFDEGEGAIAHDSTGYHDGTIQGDPNWVAGYASAYALDFGGDDGVYLEGSSGKDSALNIYNRDVTISAWVKIRGDGGTIVARAQPYMITYKLGVATNEAHINTYLHIHGHWLITTNEMLDPGAWYHVVGVFDRSGRKGHVYINGVEEAHGVLGEDPSSNGATTKIGCRNDTGDQAFNGTIDEVMIFNRTLSPEEIEQLYEDGLN